MSNLTTAILLGLIAFIAQSEFALGTSLLSRPIVTASLAGLVLGDLKAGVIMGASLELAFMGMFSVGASIPPDPVSAGILGAGLAIQAGAGTETALLLGMPIATLTLLLENVYLIFVLPLFVRGADKAAADGNIRKLELNHFGAGIGLSLLKTLVVMVGFLVGNQTVSRLLEMIPEFVQHGLEVAAGIIPALGFAMLAELLLNKKVAHFFFLGFFLIGYLEIPVTGIAIFGLILVIIILSVKKTQTPATEGVSDDEDF
ncbi:PTS mannose/fructose/sorbose/N-acetylgalactosamine transporter subunit IIC [Enterococcus pallens]|uniref:PTS system mannose/fructose/sorbose-specific IIC component n=1 Tax=Enterococcus pallens ATCC BAA-351 TaxID=1158607 RepID=R2SJ67_9ENTE|nr:PTS sugar transporter subunit IIC [Enterococcus pallens]EOH95260.1 PTS system mannose/fructose/sorbose-specific IIC component [Enterococcus pallens ATCC BAA-351]EOU21603.1 PTS system mannose/fructose/sorbose-specific IIC component [Enterococcus pallens ATCC BAA-351]OJG79759.1 PTS system mannose/fructose/sorbose-specific IIC component [Enterococcus pallens]